jgi:glyoxylase-like metal-dependent hydrolase (beta-lactamase superfamily II)
MARQLVDGVWLLELGLAAPFASNAYLVDDGTVSLVDAGLFVNRPSVRSELAAAGYAVGDVERVLLTHYDIDHVGGLRGLDGFRGPVYLGADDLALARGAVWPELATHKGVFHRLVRPIWDLDGYDVIAVHDGDDIGGFRASHTPGHNPGHVVYVHEDLSVAFLGDLVWESAGRLTTPEWFDSYDMAQLRESVRQLVGTAPGFEVAAMGHGNPIVGCGSQALADLAGRC